MDRYDPFEKLSDLYDSIVDWQDDPLIKPNNQNKYLFSDGKTYYEELCKILKLLSTFKTGFNQIYDNLDELEQRIEESGVTQEDLQTAINNLHTIITGEIATLESSLSSDISDLDTSLTTLTSRVGTNETNITALQTLTSTHTSDINTINTAITSIQADLLSKISDAPQDGKTYGRKNGTWTEVPGGGGGGGTSDYDALDNKPQINGNILTGNKTGAQLDLVDSTTFNGYIESESLLNQEFTYRQSQAKHNGLLNIDKIKGNTVVLNQDSLLSFNGTGLKVVGFNQWDEEWEVGGLDLQNGNPYTDNSRIRTKNFNQCLENTVYYNSAPQQAIILFYDGNFEYLGYVGANARSTFTMGSNTKYFKFYMATSYGTTYNNDICINISDTSKNGTYEPYKTTTLILPISTYFPTGMKSVGTVYDELTSSKTITRIGSVDLGTLTWTYLSNSTALRFFATLPSDAVNVDASAVANAITSKYSVASWNSVAPNVSADKMFALTSTYITIRDTSYTDATAFKNSLNGIMLYYELAAPTEQDIDIKLTSPIWNGGTEHLLPINTSTPVTSPIICDMTYLGINDEILSLYNIISEIISDMLTKTDASSIYQTILQSGVNIKTINNESLLGSGNIVTPTGAQINTINSRLDDINEEIIDINDSVSGINRILLLKMDTDVANASFMPINRIASASQLGGIKVGNGLSIDSDGVLSANGNAVYGAWQTVNITGSTSTGSAPVYSNVDIQVKYDSAKKNLLFNGSFTAKGISATVETIITTDLVIPNNTGQEISIKNVVIRDNFKARLIIGTDGVVKFGVYGSVNNSDYGLLPIPINIDNFV